ncbi:MAG: leucyl/phenylalanyl-tRNA--protein transferase [Tepidiformaceae bacterium]
MALGASRYGFPGPKRGDGFVGFGGDFAPETIVGAYRAGAFPWPHDDVDELWYSPDPRAVIPLDGLHISRRLRRTLRSGHFHVSLDAAFGQVIAGCAEREEGTWITPAIVSAYGKLHDLGWAHSFEVWSGDEELVGGLYGLGVGAMFGAESMFHRANDASKVAMVALVEHASRIGIELIDIQVLTEHTQRMGAVEVSRADYLRRLEHALAREVDWTDAAGKTAVPGEMPGDVEL